MTEKDKNLTPWQEKNLEYQRRKAEEDKKVAQSTQPKKVKFSSPFQKAKDKASQTETTEAVSEELENPEEELISESQENIFAELEDIAQEVQKNRSSGPNLIKILKNMWPVLTVAALVFLASIYSISPLSKIGTFIVSGNQNETAEQVAITSNIKTGDSIFQILNGKAGIEQGIKRQFPRISTVSLKYRFPNNFEAIIKEYGNSVYVTRNKQTYLVLDNAYVIPTAVDTKKMAKLPVLQNFSDDEVQAFVQAYETLKPELKALMTNVTKTPTDATKDFIAIDLSDGNQVRVPLSQMAEKLPYYPSIAKQVQAPQVVDMEAGIYTKPQGAYQDYLKQLADSKASALSAEKAKKEAANTTATASTTTNSQ